MGVVVTPKVSYRGRMAVGCGLPRSGVSSVDEPARRLQSPPTRWSTCARRASHSFQWALRLALARQRSEQYFA
jgi:hypothetical protein